MSAIGKSTIGGTHIRGKTASHPSNVVHKAVSQSSNTNTIKSSTTNSNTVNKAKTASHPSNVVHKGVSQSSNTNTIKSSTANSNTNTIKSSTTNSNTNTIKSSTTQSNAIKAPTINLSTVKTPSKTSAVNNQANLPAVGSGGAYKASPRRGLQNHRDILDGDVPSPQVSQAHINSMIKDLRKTPLGNGYAAKIDPSTISFVPLSSGGGFNFNVPTGKIELVDDGDESTLVHENRHRLDLENGVFSDVPSIGTDKNTYVSGYRNTEINAMSDQLWLGLDRNASHLPVDGTIIKHIDHLNKMMPGGFSKFFKNNKEAATRLVNTEATNMYSTLYGTPYDHIVGKTYDLFKSYPQKFQTQLGNEIANNAAGHPGSMSEVGKTYVKAWTDFQKNKPLDSELDFKAHQYALIEAFKVFQLLNTKSSDAGTNQKL